MDAPAIRLAGPEDEARVLAIITLAFCDDPFARWVIPDPLDHYRLMPEGARAFGGRGFAHGTVYLAGTGLGAALWLPPGIEPDFPAMDAIFAPGIPAGRAAAIEEAVRRMNASHPEEPHWFLPLLGVDPAARGRGVGTLLMRHALRRIDAEAGTAYLESSNPRNVPFYRRLGFRPLAPVSVGGSPEILPMLRPARR